MFVTVIGVLRGLLVEQPQTPPKNHKKHIETIDDHLFVVDPVRANPTSATTGRAL